MTKIAVKWRRLWAVTVVATAICAIAWLALIRNADGSDRAALAEIAHIANSMTYRTIRGRLSGPFLYRPLPPQPDETIEADARKRLIRLAIDLPSVEETPSNLQKLGIVYLLLGRVDDAVLSLERATWPNGSSSDVIRSIRRSRDARLLTSLTVAYLERARRTKSAADYITALETANCAWSLERTPVNAWNRALARDNLQFREASRDGWVEYLRLDSTSMWTGEARASLSSLQEPTLTDTWTTIQPKLGAILTSSDREALRAVVARYPQQMRIHAEDVLLPRWASSGNREDWCAIRTIGEALAAKRGEYLIREIVTVIDSAEPQRRRRLMKAYGDYAAGKRLYEMRQPQAAVPKLDRASREFANEDANILASLADVFASSALFVAERYTEAFGAAARGIRRLDRPEFYPSLIARLEWLRGLCHLALGRPYESLRSYDRALAAMKRTGELDAVAALQNLRGEALDGIGDGEGALESRLAAVRTKSVVGGRNKSEQILAGVARALFAQGHSHIALEFIDLTVAHPKFGDSADFSSEVLLLRALILQRLGREADAKSALTSARAYALQSGDERINTAMLADIDAALALNASPLERPQQRIERLTTALDHSLRTGNHRHRSRLLLYRARVLRHTGNVAAAEADLRSGLLEVESQRGGISSRQVRALYFASSHELVMELVELLIDQFRDEEAFDVAEAARSRGLLDSNGPIAATEAATHERVVSSLRRGETLVSNFALNDRVVTWIVTQTGFRLAQRPIRRGMLERFIARHDAGLGQSDPALYGALFADADAAPMRRCIFIPDPTLPPITIAVLKDDHGRYLIEKYPIVYAPSATSYLRSSAPQWRRDNATTPHILVAAASSFDASLSSELSPLSAAAGEARRIARLYTNAILVIGAELTTERFLSSAASADIVHFAGHAAGGGMSNGATLVMAPDAGRDDAGLLYARRIAEQRFVRTRLVVLSACGVTSHADVDALAVGSIAYAFLYTGVPAVIATVRPVDDQIAAAFMPRLHAALIRERDAAAALRSTQLAFIRSTNPSARDPRNWASFRLYGHYEQ